MPRWSAVSPPWHAGLSGQRASNGALGRAWAGLSVVAAVEARPDAEPQPLALAPPGTLPLHTPSQASRQS